MFDRIPVKRPGWKHYQSQLRRGVAQQRLALKIRKYFPLFALILVILCAVPAGIILLPSQSDRPDEADIANKKSLRPSITKSDLEILLHGRSLENLQHKNFAVTFGGSTYSIDTSLDIPLQQFLLDRINSEIARYIGIVVLDPVRGHILAMVSHAKSSGETKTSILHPFPAASIFKIVTAAAAIEKCGFRSDTPLRYNGKKHTLYKSQLKERRNKYTRKLSLKTAFAQSVNPVFGKIGVHYLGKEVLEAYALAFGFNRSIPFEISLAPSRVVVTDDAYHLAEIASGFNRQTTLSVLHAALIAATVLNQGRLLEPSIINQIVDEGHNILYQNRLNAIQEPVIPETATILMDLMAATVHTGTLRKTFSGFRRDRVLSKLNLGGKTGSIDNQAQDARVDWFVGFAAEKNGSEKIALAIIVLHEKYIGTRAGGYARLAIKEYFHNYFNKAKIARKQPQG